MKQLQQGYAACRDCACNLAPTCQVCAGVIADGSAVPAHCLSEPVNSCSMVSWCLLSLCACSAAELVAAQRLEAAERRKMEEKERRLKQVMTNNSMTLSS